MTRRQYAANLRKYNDRCLIELRRRGAITRQAAAQALDLYEKPCATT